MHHFIFKTQTSVSTKFILKFEEDFCLSKILNLKIDMKCVIDNRKRKMKYFIKADQLQ